jgi:signal peptidase I
MGPPGCVADGRAETPDGQGVSRGRVYGPMIDAVNRGAGCPGLPGPPGAERPRYLYSRLVDRRPATGCLVEVVETLVLTLIIFLVIQNFVAQPYQVQQNSMEQTLEPGQYVLVDKLSPRWDSYGRGDIIVFDPPESWTRDRTPFIKRVIGLAGDTVEIREDGRVYVNERALDEPYIYRNPNGTPDLTTSPGDQWRWVVGSEQLFVLGDHRSKSADSRVFGPIGDGDVIGRAFLRYWPIGTMGILDSPDYPGLAPAPS